MVKNVSEAMLTSLPNFWRISKSFMEGRYKKVLSVLPPPDSANRPRTERGQLVSTESFAVPYHGARYHQALHRSPVRILHVFRHGSHVPWTQHCPATLP